jgi:S1-C subfamily serine protease
VAYGDVFGYSETNDPSGYQKKVAALSTKEEKKKFSLSHEHKMNPLIKNINDGTKDEFFTSLSRKAGHKLRTNLIEDDDSGNFVFATFFDIDLKTMEVKHYLTMTPESKKLWNSNWGKKEEEAGMKKIGINLVNHFVNCKKASMTDDGSNVASSGSGFFINNKGYFITNNHVVDGCTQSKITFNEKSVDAELIAKDETLDLALLRANVKPKDYLNISDDPPEKMQKVFVAGYPFGKGLSDDLKFSQGIISSVKGFGDNSNQIQIDAAINSGNSGGPIVNEDGDLVAVAVSGLDKSKSEGIGFGIKASSVKNFLEVNNAKYSSSSLISFGMSNKKLNKLMEASAVYTFCN